MAAVINGRPSVSGTITTCVMLTEANPRRIMLAIVNTGGVACSIGLGSDLAYGAGIYLLPNGGSFLIDGNNPFFGAIYAVSTGAGTTLAFQETSLG